MTLLIITGPQGSGKGTQSELLEQKYGFKTYSMGDLLRKEIKNKTEIGKKVSNYLKNGDLVPDEITFKILEKILKHSNKIILDGFPRDLDQAKYLHKKAKINGMIELDIPEKETLQRLDNRRICKDCGETYNLIVNPTKKTGICDKCGGKIIKRNDDNIKSIKERLHIFHTDTRKVIDFFKKEKIPAFEIDAHQTITEVFKEIEKDLKEILKK